MPKYVYEFSEGDKDQKDLLGGKGANLAEMTRLGLPVPPGFTITTDACREYLRQGVEPAELRVQVTMALRQLEDGLGRQLGDRHDPLLVSVRSGAAVLDARHDGDRPQHRTERRQRQGSRGGERQRTIRLGLLPAAAADVSARPSCTCPGRFSPTLWTKPRPRRASRTTSISTSTTCKAWSAISSNTSTAHCGSPIPATSPRAAGPGGPGGVRLLEHRPGAAVPPAGTDPAGPGHRRQHLHRWCSATSATPAAPVSRSPVTRHRAAPAPTATTCPTPRARTSSPVSGTP